MKASVIFYEKYLLQDRYLIVLEIHEVKDVKKYPLGLKYGLICLDNETGKRVLMDNHHPKGDHIHINSSELSYKFQSVERLISDFKKLVLVQLGIKL